MFPHRPSVRSAPSAAVSSSTRLLTSSLFLSFYLSSSVSQRFPLSSPIFFFFILLQAIGSLSGGGGGVGGVGVEGKLENVPNWQNSRTLGDQDLCAATVPVGIYLLLFNDLHWKETPAAGKNKML